MLAAALRSLDDLRFRGAPPEVRVVVVDNDPAGTAAAVVDSYRERGRWPVSVTAEARPGVAHVRNAALAEALALGGEALVFFDDDQEATAGWLEALLGTRRRFGAEAVAGPVMARFEPPTPRWLRGAGADLHDSERHPTGRLVRHVRAGNLLLTRRALAIAGAPTFDPRYGLSGGEDRELCERLWRGGARLIWSAEALVHETVPRARQGVGWLLRRFYRYGAINAAVAVDHEGLLGAGPAVLAEAAARACYGVGSLPLVWRRGAGRAARSLRNVTYAAGLVAGLGRRLGAPYAETDGR